MLTISELNSTVWFRVLKVIYLFFGIFCLLSACAVSYAMGSNFYENQDAYLTEQANNQKLIAEIKDLKSHGYDSKQISDKVIKPMTGYSPYVLNEIYDGQDSPKLDFVSYDRNHQKPPTLYWLFLIVPVVFIFAWLIFSLPKWIFYYIYFGAIKPKK